jgi:hypothetical protein
MSISFILSLFLVERQERARRSSEHPGANQSLWSTSTLQRWLDPEPYQDPSDTTWQDADGISGDVPHPKKKAWFMRKKHREISRMQVTEALEMRGTILVLLLVCGCVGLVGLWWMGTKAYHGMMARLF